MERLKSVEGILEVEMVITAYFLEESSPVNPGVATSTVGKSLNG